MAEWLIRFGLGGVQSFIAESRKLRDFAAASTVFSEIAKATFAECPVVPILPVTKAVLDDGSQVELPFRPHQITLRVEGNRDRVDKIGEAMTTAARRYWTTHALKALTPQSRVRAEGREVEVQLASALEVYWTAVPLDTDSDNGYADAFWRLTHTFDARRYTRTFSQLEPLSTLQQWACSQCGARPAVTDKPESTALPLYSAGERQCAVCLAKRVWKLDDGRFESTHVVARNRYAYDPVFMDTRRKHGVDPPFLKLDAADRQEIAAEEGHYKPGELASLLDSIDARCSPYYALIAFDGDSMGKWFSEASRFKAPLAEAQKELGKSLTIFASTLRGAVRRCDARLVYAGGDDGFVVAPLDGVIALLGSIHENWVKNVQRLREIVSGPLPTLSLHVSVVHAKTPLQPALARMQTLLKRTKEDADRDAFSILADVRAGASALMVAKWKDFEGLRRAVVAASNWEPEDQQRLKDCQKPRDLVWTEFQSLYKEREERRFPMRLLHSLMEALPPFFDANGKLRLPRELRNEIARLAHRSGGRAGGQNPSDLHAETIDWLVARGGGIHSTSGVKVAGYEALDSAIAVVAFLARELSWKPLPKESATRDASTEKPATTPTV